MVDAGRYACAVLRILHKFAYRYSWLMDVLSVAPRVSLLLRTYPGFAGQRLGQLPPAVLGLGKYSHPAATVQVSRKRCQLSLGWLAQLRSGRRRQSALDGRHGYPD